MLAKGSRELYHFGVFYSPNLTTLGDDLAY